MDGMRAAAKALINNAVQIVDVVAFTAFHIACGAKEFAESGFGIPEMVTVGASLSIMACTIGGTTSLAMDLASKVYGRQDCDTCDGWEALVCTSCHGTGKVQYFLIDTGGEDAAKSVLNGSATTKQAPSSLDTGYTLPTKYCTVCSGTGVMKCTECNGVAWKDEFHMEQIANLPTQAIKAHKRLNIPNEYLLNTLEDPEAAEFLLFTLPELETGRPFDVDAKKQMWGYYEKWRRQRMAHEVVANRAPGWETAQQVLVAKDPTGTLEDPVIVKNVSYYKARRAVEAEVDRMEMPARPTEWATSDYPLKESDWSEEDLKDPKKKEERDVLLGAQDRMMNELLDVSWQNYWREQKVMELTKKKIEDFVNQQASKELKAAAAKAEAPTPAKPEPAAKKPSPAVASSKSSAPQMSKEEKKKKERRERAEKMAKQAAEREAALKAARSGK